MLIAVLSGFLASLIAPWVHRLFPGLSGWIFAMVPLASTSFFAAAAASVTRGATVGESYFWAPSLGLNPSFYLDGLSLLFALLILGTGTLVLIYSSAYLKGPGTWGLIGDGTTAALGSLTGPYKGCVRRPSG